MIRRRDLRRVLIAALEDALPRFDLEHTPRSDLDLGMEAWATWPTEDPLEEEDRPSIETWIGWIRSYAPALGDYPSREEARTLIPHLLAEEILEDLLVPGPHHWRRWKWLARAWSKAYVLGITASGPTFQGATGPDGYGPLWVAPHPSIWWSLDPRKHRPYALGKRTDWWRCLLRYHHLRGVEIGLGSCGKCAPWPCCGSTAWDHLEGCEGDQ